MKYNLITDLTINQELKSKLINFALVDGLQYFKQNSQGPHRRFCKLNSFDISLNYEVQKFAENCYKKLDIDKIIEESLFGNFIGVNSEGGFVHQHTDPKGPNNERHVRLNFMLQKPDIGGDILIDDIEYRIDEGQAWLNFASEWYHASTPVKGDKERIILSLGNLIEEPMAHELYKKVI